MPSAEPDPHVAALGRELERTQRRLAAVEVLAYQLADEAQSRADAAATEAEDQAEVEESDQTGDRSWLLLGDSEQATAVLADLIDWLDRVYLRYPGTALPSCWLWHPAVVEELWWLRQAHRAAYSSQDGSPGKVADWHDRQRPGVAKRIKTALGDCELSRHTQPRPAPTAPLTASAPRIADMWTRSQTAPTPTPDELTEADHHERQQHQNRHR